MDKSKNIKIMMFVFLAIGICIIIGGIIFQVNNMKFLKTATKTEAKITNIVTSYDSDGDANHSVNVKFMVNGEEYGGILGEWSSSMYVGKTVTVYYNPNNPNEFRSGSSGFVGFILIAFGAVFAIIGTVFLINDKKRKNKKEDLEKNGIKVYAKINDIYKDNSYSFNGRNPYVIECSCEYNGKIYTFISEHIWGDVKTIAENKNISELEVLLNPDNPDEYYVNIEQLKQYIGN